MLAKLARHERTGSRTLEAPPPVLNALTDTGTALLSLRDAATRSHSVDTDRCQTSAAPLASGKINPRNAVEREVRILPMPLIKPPRTLPSKLPHVEERATMPDGLERTEAKLLLLLLLNLKLPLLNLVVNAEPMEYGTFHSTCVAREDLLVPPLPVSCVAEELKAASTSTTSPMEAVISPQVPEEFNVVARTTQPKCLGLPPVSLSPNPPLEEDPDLPLVVRSKHLNPHSRLSSLRAPAWSTKP
jgi:hypothetical protein